MHVTQPLIDRVPKQYAFPLYTIHTQILDWPLSTPRNNFHPGGRGMGEWGEERHERMLYVGELVEVLYVSMFLALNPLRVLNPLNTR